MKSLITKNIFTFVIIALAFFGQQASAQITNDFFVVDPFQSQASFGGFNSQSAQISQLLQLVALLQEQLNNLNNQSFINSNVNNPNLGFGNNTGFGFNGFNNSGNFGFVDTSYYGSLNNYNGSDPRAITMNPRDVEDDSAELRGEVDMNDFNNGIVFFVYGQDEDMIEDVEDDYDSYDDVRDDEEDDDFEVERVDNDLDGQDDYSEEVDDLEEDEDYYYIICVEYEDEDDDETLECGKIEEFDTDDNDDDEPEVNTLSADNVNSNSAELRGEVDMNDFNNGLVFFVWGEDEDQVEDVDEEDQYSDIDTDGDDLRRAIVDSDLDEDDGEEEYELNVFGLNNNQDIYFRICVEYEDEDDDDTIECGNVRDFNT